MENAGKKQNIAIALSMFASSGMLFVRAMRLDNSTHLGMTTGTRLVPVIATMAMLVVSAIGTNKIKAVFKLGNRIDRTVKRAVEAAIIQVYFGFQMAPLFTTITL